MVYNKTEKSPRICLQFVYINKMLYIDIACNNIIFCDNAFVMYGTVRKRKVSVLEGKSMNYGF